MKDTDSIHQMADGIGSVVNQKKIDQCCDWISVYPIWGLA